RVAADHLRAGHVGARVRGRVLHRRELGARAGHPEAVAAGELDAEVEAPVDQLALADDVEAGLAVVEAVRQRRLALRTAAAAAARLLVGQPGVVEGGVVGRCRGVVLDRGDQGLLVGVGTHGHLQLVGLAAAHALLLSWAPDPAPTSSRSPVATARGRRPALSTRPRPDIRLLPNERNRESTAISGWVKRKTMTRSRTVDRPSVNAKPFTSPIASTYRIAAARKLTASAERIVRRARTQARGT